MASAIPKVPNLLIENIKMDHFGFTTGRTATVGVASCICFVILLNDGQEVFLEHRSAVFFCAKVTPQNVGLCFQNLAEHISEVLPASTITAVLIVGGNDKSSYYCKLQAEFDCLIEAGGNDDDEDISHHYKQLLATVKLNDVCFNIEDNSNGMLGQSNVDVVVDKNITGEERMVVILQHLKTIRIPDIFIGVLTIEIKNNRRLFTIDQSVTKNNESRTSAENAFVIKVADHFQARAKALGAAEVDGDAALSLLIYGRDLSSQIDQNFSVKQKELTDDDQEMCECLVSNSKGRYQEDDDDDEMDDDEDDMSDLQKL